MSTVPRNWIRYGKKWMENMDQKAGIIVNIKKADVDSQPNMGSF